MEHGTQLEGYEAQQDLFIELYPEAIMIHSEGNILHANLACMNLLAASSLDDLIGKSLLDFSPPEYKDVVEERICKLDQHGIVISPTEVKAIRLDGKIIDVEVRGISLNFKGKPAYFMIIHDLTNKKQAEEALRESEARYRLIAENMTDLVCIIDYEGIFKYASPSHVSVLGFPSEAYEGKRGREFMHQDDLPHVRKHFDEMVESKDVRVFHFRFKNIRGEWIWVEAKATPIFHENGEFEHFLIVSREITERKMYEEKLTYLAFHDTLTGLPNRRLFNDRLEKEIRLAELNNRYIAVIYMDIDNFKQINDNLGHDIGDEFLKQFAQRVKGCLREMDCLARQGGDEFTIIVPELNEEIDAINIAERIITALQEPWEIGEYSFHTTSSIGIAFYPKDGTSRLELLKQSDVALYGAKRAGKNNYKVFS
ncbi:diguanylate cyclase domain-containing protein [Neobacillus sp. LXY-1]|uniref:diguanylate cyclase domain-containing protein n=1 Tax=Neobacillus sp. LXY-1 TaxID=3379133 RepID=UPI003EE36C9C